MEPPNNNTPLTNSLTLATKQNDATNVTSSLMQSIEEGTEEQGDIITIEQCRTMSPTDLLESLGEKFKNIISHLQDLKNITDSKSYSICLASAESDLETAKNILLSGKLENQDNYVSIQEQLKELEQAVDERFNNRPAGPSVLLPRDLKNIQQLSKIGENTTYTTDLGTFFTPQVSPMELLDFFGKIREQGNYLSVCVAYKMDKIYHTSLDGMATIISLTKKRIDAEEQMVKSTGKFSNIKSSFAFILEDIGRDFKQMGRELLELLESGDRSQVEYVTQMPEIQNETTHPEVSEQQELAVLSDKEQQQLALLCGARDQLLSKLEPWNFASVEVATSNDIVKKFNPPPQFIGEADCVILYHKRVDQDK